MDNGQASTSVVNEVPETLRRLVLMLAKVFYGPQHYILMDYLQQNVCVKEDRLRELLKFEPRNLRQILVSLKVGFYFSFHDFVLG
jgi:transcription initiation factor IIE alpha subunit